MKNDFLHMKIKSIKYLGFYVIFFCYAVLLSISSKTPPQMKSMLRGSINVIIFLVGADAFG